MGLEKGRKCAEAIVHMCVVMRADGDARIFGSESASLSGFPVLAVLDFFSAKYRGDGNALAPD